MGEMSLSKTLQSPDIISSIKGKTIEEIKDILGIHGRKYYADNPQETETIRYNLASFGFPSDSDTVKNVQKHIIYHYAEKILPLAGAPAQLADFVEKRIDFLQAKDMVSNALQKGSVLITVSHFGGVESIVATLSYLKFTINPVLKFTTQSFSQSLRSIAVKMEESGLFAPINFIELGKPGTQNALSMARVLDKKEILFTAFDEDTPHSKPVKLFNRNILGGTGLERLLKFAHGNVSVFSAFMIREGERYRLQLFPVDNITETLTQQMFDNLQSVLEKHFEQWYFLHEKIHFID
jgi:lauroyl/myristoyl acyltransferase